MNGLMNMEATLDLDELSKSPTGEIVADETTEELDEILDEVVNLAETVEAENSILDNIVPDGEEAVEETDFTMQPGETLELEIDLPIEATESQAKKKPLAEETEAALDALIEAETEVMDALAKEAGANGFPDSSSTVADKYAESKNTEKSLAEDANTREDSVCDAPVENTVSDETSDKLPADNEQSSHGYLVNQESESEVEDVPAPVGEACIPQVSIDQLTDMLRKKIDATIARLIEERLSVIVERSIAETLERILANIR